MEKSILRRNTKQKKLVFNTVLNSTDHPTAETIYTRAIKEAPNISLATVYRNLSLLADSGEIKKIASPEGADHFDFNTSCHYHFFCKECRQIVDIPDGFIKTENSVNSLENSGFSVDGFSLTYYGVCTKCTNIGGNENE